MSENVRQPVMPDAGSARAEMTAASFEYIEVFYNRTRRYSMLGYQSPMQFLERWRLAQHEENLAA